MATIQVEDPAAIGPALREIRISEGVTQSALADLARVGRQWLNAFEMGDKPSAPLDMVMRVTAALDVTLTLRPENLVGDAIGDQEPIDLDAYLDEFDA